MSAQSNTETEQEKLINVLFGSRRKWKKKTFLKNNDLFWIFSLYFHPVKQTIKFDFAVKYLQRNAITNVIAGSMLLRAHEKVGEVNFNPA